MGHCTILLEWLGVPVNTSHLSKSTVKFWEDSNAMLTIHCDYCLLVTLKPVRPINVMMADGTPDCTFLEFTWPKQNISREIFIFFKLIRKPLDHLYWSFCVIICQFCFILILGLSPFFYSVNPSLSQTLDTFFAGYMCFKKVGHLNHT